ncbi:MAG: hypothetical protein WA152_04115 [Microgenomates group bacterium]
MTERTCEQLKINDITCLRWRHKLAFPSNGPTNTRQVAEVVSSLDPQCVSWDHLNFYAGGDAVWEKKKSSADEINFVQETFVKKKTILLFSDFKSEAGSNKYQSYLKKEAEKIGISVGTVSAFTTLALMAGRDRRSFLKGIGIFSVASLLSLTSIKIVDLFRAFEEIESIESCEYKPSEPYEPMIADSSWRTGMVIAKQSWISELGYLKDYQHEGGENISIWGSGHLDNAEELKLINKIANDPGPHAEELIEEEITFLSRNGVEEKELRKKIINLRMAMAGIMPVKTEDRGDLFYISPIKPAYYDPRILGFDAGGMTADRVSAEVNLRIKL